MPEPLTGYIESLNDYVAGIGDYLWDDIGDCLSSLHDSLSAEGCPNSGDICLSMKYDFDLLKLWYGSIGGAYRNSLIGVFNWIDDNWPTDGDEYELTMDKILAAMWDSDRLRNFLFINYIDAMRAGIWNTEIYEKHLIEWYRHFSK